MSEHAAVVGEHAIKTEARRRRAIASILPVTALVVVDVILSVAVFLVSYKLRQHTDMFVWRPRKSFWPVGVVNDFEPYLGFLFFVPLVKVYMLRRYGLYRLRGEFSFGNDFGKIFSASTLASLVLVLIAFLFRQGFFYREGHFVWLDYSYSRLVFVYDWLIAVGAFWVVRSVVRVVQILYRSKERNLIPTVVVGCGEMAQVCVSEISQKRRLGYKLVGAVRARGNEDSAALTKYGVRMLGGFDDLPELVKRYGVEEVLITDTRINPRKMFEVLMECGRDHHIKYRVIPNLFDCLPGKTEIATIGSLPMIKLYEEGLRGSQRALKRGMDVLVSIGLLLITWPFWVALAILIKMESRGPVFLKQERVGMDGNVFLMIKFRSMADGVDDQAHRELMRRTINGEDANQGTPDEPIYGKVKDDPRLTRIGSWMRRYSFDELPQTFNVLMGQMSIVGPRPPIPYEVRHYKDWHRTRFHVRPGITGLWQVSGRNRLHFEEMVRLDVFYIENWSPWLDVKIMLKTLPVMLRGDNTY
ncbi:MAG TPA: sugar transferase [Blastocatellia bacterium]|nr:sugar transferase [Blastocatellia bacterium]